MRFIVFVASFLAMFVIRKAALDEEGKYSGDKQFFFILKKENI